ncbi:hypothetical protein C0U41_29375, partial [Klebsiella pneumoniae]
RVALLGDAGHSTTPDIGQGGCAAMEDAVVLGAFSARPEILRPPCASMKPSRVALLGDAGHSTTPDIGQGGCAAMEDAVVLGA